MLWSKVRLRKRRELACKWRWFSFCLSLIRDVGSDEQEPKPKRASNSIGGSEGGKKKATKRIGRAITKKGKPVGGREMANRES